MRVREQKRDSSRTEWRDAEYPKILRVAFQPQQSTLTLIHTFSLSHRGETKRRSAVTLHSLSAKGSQHVL